MNLCLMCGEYKRPQAEPYCSTCGRARQVIPEKWYCIGFFIGTWSWLPGIQENVEAFEMGLADRKGYTDE